ncbi:MAG: NAD-dependent epimerase/dehydratase family protein [Saprospiraceae bacterium]|nr:NAD-dependent epimerase/dehydratase family protein [Saprospiraceae bacterium]
MHKNDRILVTGATGFIGSYVLRTLIDKGYNNVVAMKREKSKMDLVQPVIDQVQWLDADLLDISSIEEIIKDIKAVVHAAAMVSFDRRDRQKIYKVNIEGTSNLVNCCLEHDIDKFIQVSSIAVFSRKGDKQEIDEQTNWDYHAPATDYAISKYKAEMEVWRAGAEGLPIAIINPSLVLGAGFWDSGSASLFKKNYDGLPFYPRGVNGFVDVRDVADAVILLLEKPIVNQRFVINGENLSYLEVSTMMAEALGRKPPHIALNPFLRELALFRAWILRNFFGREEVISRGTLRNAQRHFYFDSTKSREVLGLKYRPIRDTIQETCRLVNEAAKDDFQPKYLPLK